MSAADGIRAALASYAADSSDNLYPLSAAIANYADLRNLVNQNGGTLPEKASELSMKQITYQSSVERDTYTLTIELDLVRKDMLGKTVVLTPSGIEKR